MAEELVPDMSARQNAVPAMQPYLNVFPLPTYGIPDDVATGISQFKASFSNSAKLDAYSLRIDHRLDDKRVLFRRYSYSPSTSDQRGNGTLNSVTPSRVTLQTATVGGTWSISPSRVNDLRFNYSGTDGNSRTYMDEFGGGLLWCRCHFPRASTPATAPWPCFGRRWSFPVLSLDSKDIPSTTSQHRGQFDTSSTRPHSQIRS